MNEILTVGQAIRNARQWAADQLSGRRMDDEWATTYLKGYDWSHFYPTVNTNGEYDGGLICGTDHEASNYQTVELGEDGRLRTGYAAACLKSDLEAAGYELDDDGIIEQV